ncbi:P-type conjugative transfer protein TrbG [Sphingomonas koreensis]|nr:P-type conjugative transfer protein TrbG [Sphingomonas koreensis]
MFPASATALAAIALTAAAAPPLQKSPSAARPVTVTPKPAPKMKTTRRHHRILPRTPRAVGQVASANMSATLEPAAQGFVNAAQVYPYADDMLFRAYTAPGRVTDIALQPGEALVSVASGDTVRWVIGDTTSGAGADKRTHVLVKPFTAGLATNLVIMTDRHSYHLALTSTTGAAMAALSWTYPQDALIAIKRSAAEAAAPVAAGLEIDRLRFDYEVSGDKPAWRPLRAFDDGRQTFIEFPENLSVGEAPPLFLVDRKGDAQLVNYRVRGRYYIVDRLFDVAELRLGTKHQEVVRIARVAAQNARRAS